MKTTLTLSLLTAAIIGFTSCKKEIQEPKTPDMEQPPVPTLSFDTATIVFPIKIGGGGWSSWHKETN
jgi:hypothetical protein